MIYNGIELELPNGRVAFSHSRMMDIIKGESSNANTNWTDLLWELPWGQLKDKHPDRFADASKICSILNMNYQVCNGGIGQYFFNGYHEYRGPYSEHDVEQYALDAQKEYFSELVKFAQAVYPDREEENAALAKACERFQELWFEEDAELIETIYCDEDEYIHDDDLDEDVPNPDYFEPYDETYNEDVVHGEEGFDDIYYNGNDYLEELVELQAQLCCKSLVLEVEHTVTSHNEMLSSLKETLPASAFRKPSLNDRIQDASARSGGGNEANAPELANEDPEVKRTT